MLNVFYLPKLCLASPFAYAWVVDHSENKWEKKSVMNKFKGATTVQKNFIDSSVSKIVFGAWLMEIEFQILENETALNFKLNSSHPLVFMDVNSLSREISAQRNQKSHRPGSSPLCQPEKKFHDLIIMLFSTFDLWGIMFPSQACFLIECDWWANEGHYSVNWSQLCYVPALSTFWRLIENKTQSLLLHYKWHSA